MGYIIGGVELLAGGLLQQYAGIIHAAVEVDVVVQPLGDGSKLALFHQRIKIDILLHGVQDLAGIGAAQRVAGEVAEHAAGPVHILHHALAVVRHIHAHGNKTSQMKQVGNAVPPLLAKAIAEVILEDITKN